MMDDIDPKKSRSGSETRQKTRLVSTRYSEEEYVELEERASEAGLTCASYQRVQCLASPTTRSTRRASIDRELMGKALAQINKVGSNLNQIARAANVGETQHAEIRAVIAEVSAVVRDIQAALGQRPGTQESQGEGQTGGSLPAVPSRPNYAILQPVKSIEEPPKPARPRPPMPVPWNPSDKPKP